MPINGQCGFIFLNNVSAEGVARVAAHELGHGAFRLYHTFSSDNRYVLPEGTTDNLMDYNGGTALYKYQWDYIHDPQTMLFAWAEEEEEGAMKISGEDQLRNALQQIRINGCAFCKECEDAQPLEGGVNLTLGGKKFRCSFGKLKDDNTIESQNTSYPHTNDQNIKIGQLSIAGSYNQFVILIKQEQNSITNVVCEAKENYDTYCTQKDPFAVKTFTDKVIADIKKCATQENYSGYKTSFAFNQSEKSTFDEIKTSINEKLQNSFFSNVKLCVELTNSEGGKETLLTKGLQNCTDADIKLRIHVDNQNSKVSFDIDVSDNYLQEYVSKWQQKAANKGYDDIDVESLRQQVINELESTEVQGWFGSFCQSLGSLINQKIGGFVEVLQTSQKLARNIWEEGQLPEGTWHSNKPETGYNDYPKYARFEPAIPGACDAIIDEIMGIPLIVKMGYQVMTDSKQREAFSQVFTKEGMKALKNGLADQVKELAGDGQRQEHAVVKTSVTVVFAVVTGGGNVLIKGGKKLLEMFDVLEGLAQKFKNCTKLSGYIAKLQESGQKVSEKIAKVSSNAEKVGAEQVEKLVKETDDIERAVKNLDDLTQKFQPADIEDAMKFIPDDKIEGIIQKLAKFKNCEGVEDIIKDLGTGKTKSIGARFVLEYADNFEANAVKFEVKELIETTTEQGEKLITRRYDAIINGVKHEMKCWREWQGWSDNVIYDQFVKDISNQTLDKLEDLQWIFKKTEGIADIDVLRKNVVNALEKNSSLLKTAFEANRDQFRKLFGDDIKTVNDIIDDIDDADNFKLIFKIH
jgi:hypothetical protein